MLNNLTKIFREYWILLPIYILIILSVVFLIGDKGGQQFSIQADSFLQGRLDLSQPDVRYQFSDTYVVDGKYYWPLGPFPAIIMMPFVLATKIIGLGLFPQSIVQIGLNIGIIFFCYKLARKYLFSRSDSALLASAFVFGSVYAIAAFNSYSWHFSHAVTVFAGLWAFYEYLIGKKRMWLIGILFAVILLTRITATIPVLYFLFVVVTNKSLDLKQKGVSALKLLSPIFIAFIFLMIFNYTRSGNLMDIGYRYAQVYPQILVNMREGYGLFSFENIISNIYIYFLMPLDPVFSRGTWHLVWPYFKVNPIGLSIFIVAPIFTRLIIYWRRLSDQQSIKLWLAILPTSLILLTYYASGFWTLGPRYLLDVWPFCYILLMMTFRKPSLSRLDKLVIVLSSLLNAYLYFVLMTNSSTLYWETYI